MTDWFFYQERGQTKGPVKVDELRQRVRDGVLRAFDLIYKEGEASWKMAMEHADLRDAFREAGQNPVKGRPWVCLSRKGDDTSSFKTDGPYSDEEIRTALSSGRLGYGDFLWRAEYVEWTRIGDIPLFNPRAKAPVREAAPEPSAEEMLTRVVELKRARPSEPEPAPEEADGEDLTRHVAPRPPSEEETRIILRRSLAEDEAEIPPAAPPATAPHAVERSGAPPAAQPLPDDIGLIMHRRRPRRSRAPVADYAIVAALVVVLAGALAWALHRRRAPEVIAKVEPIVAAPPPPVAAPKPEPAPITTEPVGEVAASEESADEDDQPRVTTELRLSVTTTADGQATVDVRSDGSEDQPILVQIIGLAGQVSDGPGFYRLVKTHSSGSLGRAAPSEQLKLPLGKFHVIAESGPVKKEIFANPGAGDARAQRAIQRQRKLGAAQLWTERLGLYRAASQLERAVTTAGVGRPARGLPGALTAVTKQNGERYLFYDDWVEIKTIAQAARQGVTNDLVARARKVRERITSLSVWRNRAS